ncbi:MAG TPA: hypothetical protein VK996_14645 [Ramlibacter sp.]|nr:hypothetical protein [Ramlibacter sp.]
MKTEIARLSAENAQLRATPAAMAAEVEVAVKAKDAQAAQAALKRLMDRYPASPEVNPSIQRVSSMVAQLRAEQDEARRIAALGFKAIKVKPSFTHNDTTLTVGSAAVGKTWTYDSYGTGWKYLEAEKGKRFVMLRATLASKNKEPSPFGVAAYSSEGGTLTRLGIMRYRFARWTDFGSYLGNHADYRNDFAHSPSVAFSLGVQAADEQLARRPIYLVATREGCHTRTYERLAQPRVHYVPGACLSLKPTLTLDDFKDGSLAIVKRID